MVAVLACSGCNGGISNNSSATYTVQAVRLVPFLRQQYSQHFVDNICILKIDAEVRGYKIYNTYYLYTDFISITSVFHKQSSSATLQGHDVVILEDMIHFHWRPPVIWLEWFFPYQFSYHNKTHFWGINAVKHIIWLHDFKHFLIKGS